MPNPVALEVDVVPEWLSRVGASNPMPDIIELYQHPGPFTSVYLSTADRPLVRQKPLDARWQELRRRLVDQGASERALVAIDRRLALNSDTQAAALCVIAAADGKTLLGQDHLRPTREVAQVGPLPAVAQLLEWRQRRIPTLLAVAGDSHVDVASYAVDSLNRRYCLRDDAARLVPILAKLAVGVDAQLMIVAGHGRLAERLAAELPHRLPIDVRVVREDSDGTLHQLFLATMRHVGVAAAGVTLRHLREQRFLATVDGAVDGEVDTVDALRMGLAELLLVHERSSDDRVLHIGRLPQQLSLARSNATPLEVPLVDGLLRSAILQGSEVRVTPSIGPTGPAGDVGAITMRGTTSFRF